MRIINHRNYIYGRFEMPWIGFRLRNLHFERYLQLQIFFLGWEIENSFRKFWIKELEDGT